MSKLLTNRFRLITLIFLIFFGLLNIYWVRQDIAPPQWDQSHYLEGSEYVYQSLTKGGILEFLQATTIVLPRRAPLIAILPTPIYLIFGNNPDTALIINFLSLIVFYIFFYLLIKRFFSENVALLSLIIVSIFPLFYGLLRQFFVEFSLMTVLVVWLYFAIKTELFANRKYLFWFGVISGIAMMLKFHFILYIIGPLLYLLYKNFKSTQPIYKNPLNILLMVIPFLIITVPWYTRNILTVLWHAKKSSSPENLGIYYYGPPFSMANVYNSLLDYINYVISGYYFIIIIGLILISIYANYRLKLNFFLASWFFIPFLVFFFGPNKDYRFMLPLLPPLAIFISNLLFKTFKKNTFVCLTIILFFPFLLFVNSVINLNFFHNKQIAIGPIIIFSNKLGSYIYQPDKNSWPLKLTLEYLENLEPRDRIKTIITGSEYKYFNINNLIYFAKKDQYKLQLITASYLKPTTNTDQIKKILDQGDYFIMKVSGENGPPDINWINSDLLQLTLAWKKIPNQIQFPDGGKLLILKNPNL